MHEKLWDAKLRDQKFKWNQSLDEVRIFIPIPVGSEKRDVHVQLNTRKIEILILDDDYSGMLEHPVVHEESTWYIEDRQVHVILAKARPGETWSAVYVDQESGSLMNYDFEEEKRNMLLRRFESEHPDFDFSHAEFFGGSIPDARTFLGGFTVK